MQVKKPKKQALISNSKPDLVHKVPRVDWEGLGSIRYLYTVQIDHLQVLPILAILPVRPLFPTFSPFWLAFTDTNANFI
jgi:hypothetical protein